MKKMKIFLTVIGLCAATALTASTWVERHLEDLGITINYLSPDYLKDHGPSIIIPDPAIVGKNMYSQSEINTGISMAGQGVVGVIHFGWNLSDEEKALWRGHRLSMKNPGGFYKLRNNVTGEEEPNRMYFPFRFKTPLPDYLGTDEEQPQYVFIDQSSLDIYLILNRLPTESDEPLVLLYNPHAPDAPRTDEKEYTLNFVIQPQSWARINWPYIALSSVGAAFITAVTTVAIISLTRGGKFVQ